MQHLRSGIVSWVYKHGQAVSTSLEDDDTAFNAQHSPEIDSIMGKTTKALLVVPFYCGQERRGVLSFVKLRCDATAFDVSSIEAAEALAEVLARAVERHVQDRITR